MKYKTYYAEENDSVRERYRLIMERISEIKTENTVKEPYRDYFVKCGDDLLFIKKLFDMSEEGSYRKLSISELQDINLRLHGEIRDNYDKSYLNPTYMNHTIGEEYGKYLLWLGVSIRNLAASALSVKLEPIAAYAEVFVEIYNLFESEDLSEKNLKNIIYWFVHDCSEIFIEYNIREMFDEKSDFALSIIRESDLRDLKYLYYYGAYISRNEIETAKLLNTFSEDKIEAMAKTYTEGFIKGFKVLGKDISKKETVEIRYSIGFERVIKVAICQFEKVGLKTVIRLAGCDSTPANRQYGYDHRYLDGPIFDKCIKDRNIEVLKVMLERYKDMAGKMAGPAVLETFGEIPFSPEDKKEAVKYTQKQYKLRNDYNREYTDILHRYVREEERSFTIIAYPVTDIGENYREIFEETIKINNLDENMYKNIQTQLINALDKGKYVEIKGMNGNKTNLRVSLKELKNPEKETLFENCLADVNIPLGEVFTSPKLTGTEGILHVTKVYLKGLNYIDLSLKFKDGCIEEYSCGNFDSEAANKAYIKENLLKGHDTLPMGEFAIGTNTTAYVVGQKYNIIPVMPILIVEKMGPHFAVGDTCYSYEEEEKTYNPDGKEIAAKSNEISDLRKTEPEKAYFNCHTDITIPYNELGQINVITRENTVIPIIKEGRFVLRGTEMLNDAFDKK